MSFVECNPNHCPTVLQAAENIVKLELLNKEMLNVLILAYSQYSKMPDGTLGKGLTNKPFFEMKDLIEKVTGKSIEEVLKK